MADAPDSCVHPVLLYDGVCGLCNGLVQFILRRDPKGVFRFASLQSELAGTILERHRMNARDLDTVYLVLNYERAEESLLARSDAVISILGQLGAAELRAARPGLTPGSTQASSTTKLSLWRIAGFLLQTIPRFVRDWGYGMIARSRYRIFGRYETCPLPSQDTRDRFLA